MNDPYDPSPDGTLERTPDGGVIRFERRLAHPIREVWEAITTGERLADWWLPFDAEASVDLREGGQMVFSGISDGEPITMAFTILRVEAPMLLEHTHVADESYMRWELEPVETGCTLRLSCFVTDVDSAIEGCNLVGLHTSLGRLEPCLAGRPVPWDWGEFAVTQAHYAALGLAPQVEAS